jgi:iron complex outermembrane receptor protein
MIVLQRGLLAGASAMALGWGATAAAQTAPAAEAPVEVSVALEEVVVTARRREENVQDVPVAVAVIGGEQLARQGISTVGQLTQVVPSLQILSSNPRNTALTIRGLGASYGLANDGLEQGVGVYVDQVYASRPATATFDFVDIERVEVLRGPQGTLFGKNTTAGALNITTRAPTFDFEAQGELSVGDYDFFQAKASIAGPLVEDRLAGRLSFVRTEREGFLDNVVTGEKQNSLDNTGFKGQLLFTPTEDLTVRLYGDWGRQEPVCCTQVYVTAGQTLRPAAQQFAALAAGRGYAPPSLNYADRLADVDADIQATQELGGVSAIVDYDFGWATLTSISAYRKWDWEPANDRDYTSLDILRQSANPSKQDQTSQEIRLASNGRETIEWVAGLYYFEQNVTTTGVTEYGRDAAYWLTAAQGPDALLDGYKIFNSSSIDTESYAAFGQATWNIRDDLRLTGGLRYTQETKDGVYAATTQGGLVTTDPVLIARRNGVARAQAYAADIDDGVLTGQASISYDVNRDVLVYASYALGSKSGGINMAGIPNAADGTPALTSAVVDPEEVTTFELGLKSQLFDRRLTANLALYATEIADFQANVVDSGPGALRGYLANIEKVEVRGAELDLAFRATDDLNGYFTLAYTDGEYASFTNGPCPLERIGTSTAACDLSGVELPGVSPWAASLGGEYRRTGRLLWAVRRRLRRGGLELSVVVLLRRLSVAVHTHRGLHAGEPARRLPLGRRLGGVRLRPQRFRRRLPSVRQRAVGQLGPGDRQSRRPAHDRRHPARAALSYWLTQRIRAIQATSLRSSVRSGYSGFSERSSTVLAVRRETSLAITSPPVVLSTTRSPRRGWTSAPTMMRSPSRNTGAMLSPEISSA